MALNRQGICDTIRDCLKADTTTLFGSDKLIQGIYSDPVKFNNAKTTKDRPYTIYLWAESAGRFEDRMQNVDYEYVVNIKYNANSYITNLKIANNNIDLAHEQVLRLLELQWWDGQQFTDYYTDANAKFLNCTFTNSTLEPPEESEDEKSIVMESEQFLSVIINKWR